MQQDFASEESNEFAALGVPIGYYTYVSNQLCDFITTLIRDTNTLAGTFDNLQSLGQIYTTCILARELFSTLTNVVVNASLELDNTNTPWSSPISQAKEATSKSLLCTLIQVSHLPAHVYVLATLPEFENGLRFFDTAKSALNCFDTPMASAICYDAHGIKFGMDTAH
eukprot:14284347-Ditylum_brightwellii.AAC.1